MYSHEHPVDLGETRQETEREMRERMGMLLSSDESGDEDVPGKERDDEEPREKERESEV